MKKVIIAISGASSIKLGLRMIQELAKRSQCHVILSKSAQIVWEKEAKRNLVDDIKELGVKIYDESEIWAGIASGSFGAQIMAIIPTSMNTLAKIAHGIGDDLISRCAGVMLKEKRTLLLAPREMPFSSIALENMLKLSNMGVIIAPAVLGYYAGIQTLEEMENFFVGKWLDVLGFSNQLYLRWGEEE